MKRHPAVPRRIRPGTPRTNPGSELRCLVLSNNDGEWVGVDLSSGALLRNRLEDADNATEHFQPTPLEVISFRVVDDDTPDDPARPEAIGVEHVDGSSRHVKKWARRRLLRRLAAPERPNVPILSTHGPSVAYVDLDGSMPSVVVVRISPKHLELMSSNDGRVLCSVTWGGTTQVLPVADPALRAIAERHSPRSLGGYALCEALGFKPGFVLAGFEAVRDGHVRKSIFSILAR